MPNAIALKNKQNPVIQSAKPARRRMTSPRGTILLSALIFLPFTLVPSATFAQSDWGSRKCELYENAWARALSSTPNNDINDSFRAANETFIAAGCTEKIAACPRSNDERELADMLTIAMLNEGAASTFLPFACDDE